MARRYNRKPLTEAERDARRKADRERIEQAGRDLLTTDAGGLPAIREEVTPHTLRYTCIASLFAAGADQEYVADQVGHEDVTTTNRIYRYVLQRRRRARSGAAASWRCASRPRTSGGQSTRRLAREGAELHSGRLIQPCRSVTS